jgi:hypothetical protein
MGKAKANAVTAAVYEERRVADEKLRSAKAKIEALEEDIRKRAEIMMARALYIQELEAEVDALETVAEERRERAKRAEARTVAFANNCPPCGGSGKVWLGPPGNKYSETCYKCGGDGKTEEDRKRGQARSK